MVEIKLDTGRFISFPPRKTKLRDLASINPRAGAWYRERKTILLAERFSEEDLNASAYKSFRVNERKRERNACKCRALSVNTGRHLLFTFAKSEKKKKRKEEKKKTNESRCIEPEFRACD